MISQQVVEGTAGPRARIITDPHDFAVAEPIECESGNVRPSNPRRALGLAPHERIAGCRRWPIAISH